jgi:hypothetical protein
MYAPFGPNSAGPEDPEFERRRVEFDRRRIKYEFDSRGRLFAKGFLVYVIGGACALFGYVLAWSIGLDDTARAHFTAGVLLACMITAVAVMVWRSNSEMK